MVRVSHTTSRTLYQWFGFDLGYDKTINASSKVYTAAQYNGNISGQSWRSAGDNAARQYRYSYDAANRIMMADFVQRQTFESGFTKSFNFDSKMGTDGTSTEDAYDLNGNIKKMQQWGWTISLPDFKVDNLTYNYGMGSTTTQTLSNKLISVTDQVLDETGLGDFVDKSVWYDDYSYDENGNLLEDRNKRIESISYNILNLPEVVVFLKDGGIKGKIEYKYTASGIKMEKVVTENTVVGGYSAELISRTIYANHVVYEEVKEYIPRYSSYNTVKPFGISFISHEEGRIRCLRTIPTNQVYDFVYDYMLKDHLGNVRMVLTEEQVQNNYPDATMENAAIANESKYYSNLYNTKVSKPSWFTDPMFSTNLNVARLRNNSTSQKVGPSILLKVMSGDSYNIRVAAGWQSGSNATNSSTNVLSSLVSLLSGSFPPISAGKATAVGLQSNGLGLQAALAGFMQGQPVTPNKPKAYLAWLLFDEQFKIAASGALLITNNSNAYVLNNLPVKKNGYLFVYTSNEATNIDVYFDNLKVSHIPGPLLEETHYYPFGLTMAGISSKAAGKLENKRKWNKGSELESKEFSDGSGLELYSTFYRSLDPQIGRFWQIDPRPDYSQSLYSSMSNNPLRFNDPLGDSINNPSDQRIAARIEGNINRKVTSNNQSITNSQNTITSNNEKLTKLRADVASGSLTGKDLKSANKEIGKLEKSNASANANITEMQGQNALLNQSLGDIANMRTDVNFNYTFGSPDGGSSAHFITRGTGNNVIIQGSDDGLYVHEIRHVGQSIANGGLRFSSSGKLIAVGSPDRNVTRQHEVNAYQAQFSFDRNSYPAPGGARVLADINITSLLTIPGNEY